MEEYYDYIISKPELNEDTLAHYGVKGMKWRKHKAKRSMSRSNFANDLVFNDSTHQTADFLSTLFKDVKNGVHTELMLNSPKYRKLYKKLHTPLGTSLPSHAQGMTSNTGDGKTRPLARKKKITESDNGVHVRKKHVGAGHAR